MESIESTIAKRRSVRTFDGKPLSSEDRIVLANLIDKTGNPFGVTVEFCALDAETHGLKSPAIVGEKLYVAAKVARVPNCEIAFGYEFERFCLDAASRGLGTVMLAASLNRDAFEQAIAVTDDEVMPVASPVGRPATRQSLREIAMRKALGADNRLPFEELFFEGSFDTPLDPEAAGSMRAPLESTRLAPSAGNKQPWRVVVDANQAHFYEKRSMGDSPLGDIQKVDMGIALAHFDLVAAERGLGTRFMQTDPGIAMPDGVEYIVTCEVLS